MNKAEKECCFAIGIPSFCTARTDGVSSLLPTRVVPSHCAELNRKCLASLHMASVTVEAKPQWLNKWHAQLS